MISDRVQQAIKDLVLDSDGQTDVSDVVITFCDKGNTRHYTATFTPTGDSAWLKRPLSEVEFDADHEEAMIDTVLELSDVVWTL
jgi:hypothetical protein